MIFEIFEETLARLQGRGFYYSTQERILFENLVRSGLVPNMAIFVDGLNDFYFKEEMPALTSRLAESVKVKDRVIELIRESDLPMLRLARGRSATKFQ